MNAITTRCPKCAKSVGGNDTPEVLLVEDLEPYSLIKACQHCGQKVFMAAGPGATYFAKAKRRAYRNPAYAISRRLLLKAIGIKAGWIDHKLPVGQEGEWHDVWVTRPYGQEGRIYLPRVILKPGGVANRLHAECPECGKVMRFCGLQQHVGSKTCRETRAKMEESGMFEHHGRAYSYQSQMIDEDYGQENRLIIKDEDGRVVSMRQEAASTKVMIEWFKEQIDERCARCGRLETNLAGDGCSNCGLGYDEPDAVEEAEGREIQAEAAAPFGLSEENR